MSNFDKISELLEEDYNAFFVGLEAYKAGYINDSIYESFNEHSLLGYLSVQRQHLISKVIPYSGRLKYKLTNIDIKYNLNLYDESVILSDICTDNASFYLEQLNELTEMCKIKLYSVLDNTHIPTITRLKIRIPVMYVNKGIKLYYSIYMKEERDYLDYLISMRDPGFVFDNLDALRNVVTEAYILKNVTEINSTAISSLKRFGFKMDVILAFKPEAIEFALDSIDTIGDLVMIIKAINKDTGIDVLDRLYMEFPEYSNMINDLIKEKINSLMKS